MTRRNWIGWGAVLALVPTLAIACADPKADYNAPLGEAQAEALLGSVVLRDDSLGRLLFLSSDAEGELKVEEQPLGQNVAVVEPSLDRSQLFVLSRGVFPRRDQDDERPRLSVYDGKAGVSEDKRLIKEFELDDPMERLALDRQGQWLAAFGGDATVVNPNELVLFDLSSGEGQKGVTQSKTIRSFGGAPVELIFTEELNVPKGGARRLLIVRTDRDVTLVDLKNLEQSEATIKLPTDLSGETFEPLQVVYDDGEPDDNSDARLAIRLKGSSDVVLVELGEATSSERDFSPVLNIVDVGGVPSSIDFVRTDGGLRLAALLPGQSQATLVNPKTTLAEIVALPFAFSQMRRITSSVSDAPEGGDVALLWGSSTNIAFWSLGSTSETPYRSVDTAGLSFTVSEVLDVPAPNSHLKVLRGPGSDLFVLDLDKRQSFPLKTDFDSAQVSVSSDGGRLWAYQEGSHGLSSIRLEDLHPQALYVDAGVSNVFDIERSDGGRTALILHLDSGWNATLLDAEDPDSAETRYYPALELRGLE